MIIRPSETPVPHFSHSRIEHARAGYGLAFVMALLVACLTWNAGFFDDDSVISLWQQQASQTGSMWSYCWGNFRDFLTYQGRFVPVFSFGLLPLLLVIGDDLPLYRLYFASVYVFSFLLIQYGLSRLFQSATAAVVVLAAFVANIQLQNYHDPYTSYFAYLPLASALVIGAMASFHGMLAAAESQGGIPARFVCRHLLWVLAALATWEVGVVIAATTAIQALFARTSWRRRFQFIAIPATWGILFVLANLLFKRASINTGTVVSVSSTAEIGHAYWVQLVGTLPFTLGDTGCPSVLAALPAMWTGTALAAFIFGLVLLRTLTLQQVDASPSIRDWRRPSSLAAQSLCLILVPPALTAITAKYQVELQPGMAYLQVFVQNLGLAVLIGVGIQAVHLYLGRGARLSYAAIAISLLATFTLHSNRNRQVIEFRNAFWREPRDLSATAIESFHGASNISAIMVDRPYLQRWENPDFAMRLLGQPRPFIIRTAIPADASETDRIYLNYTAAVPHGAAGFAHAGRIVASLPVSASPTPRDNLFVITRAAPYAAQLRLEYVTVDENSKRETLSITVPPMEAGNNRFISVKESRAIEAGSVRLVTTP